MASPLTRVRFAAVLSSLLVFAPLAAHADAVLHWNALAVTTLTTQPPPNALNPFQQARFAAIVQLAVFEAVNAVTGKYEPYLGSAAAPSATPLSTAPGASAEAAAIAAAYRVLVTYIPASMATLTAERSASLAAIPDGPAKEDGIATGEAAAAALIALRVGDGATPVTFYQPPTPLGAGEWGTTPGCPSDASGNPLGGVLLNWRDLKPFGLPVPESGRWSDAFMPGPPPSLTSNRYRKDYEEVKTMGAASSAERPADRTTVARFYAAASPTHLFHSAVRQLAEARGDSLTANARSLALVSIATSDSLVASFATKYHYLYWRPVTAIRLGALDGNDRTDGDADFVPLITTPCFPSYPSNHASGSSAAAETVRRIYGAAGHAIALSVTIPGTGPVTLDYTSLAGITNDVDDARVYGGIHFRFDQEAGSRLGREIATFVYKHNLRPTHPD